MFGERTKTSRIIALAGPSCSGKTTLAQALADALASTAVIPLDQYYRDLHDMPAEKRAAINFDEPAAFDWDLFTHHLEDLAHGITIDAPAYDFTTHSRAGTCSIQPAPVIIVEGLMPWIQPTFSARYDVRVYVEADDRLCLERRITRDTSDRGRTRASVETQYAATVLPMAARYVLPQRATADLVVDGTAPVTVAVQRIRDKMTACQ